ncbi:MAG: hypothetical protein ACLS36_01755 [Streptococcus sp.]
MYSQVCHQIIVSMEAVELPDKKFLWQRTHPEYHSRPNHAEELYSASDSSS